MRGLRLLLLLVCFFGVVQPSVADESARVHGVWKLVSYEVEIQATGEKEPVMGRAPTGYVIFTPEGRVMFVLTGEGKAGEDASGAGRSAQHARRVYGQVSNRGRQVDHQCRGRVEP